MPLWKVPTHRDRLGHNGLVRCRCGRRTNADMCLDLTGVPPGLLRQLGLARHGALLCDGCREALFRHDPQARRILFRALGSTED